MLLFYMGKEKISVLILFSAGMVLRLHMAHLDPFLHDWDERYHALVARNMMHSPFVPMLKSSIPTSYDQYAWCCNTVWLHKQPLFLWQMAISMKIFGVSEFTIRYPSVIMGALMIPMVYRVAMQLTKKSSVAYAAALLMCCSNYQLELVSGYIGMDHNDVAFGFYMLASIWAYTEYCGQQAIKWVILTGLFAGCAILNKWLTGLLVFAPWIVNLLVGDKGTSRKKGIAHLLLALIVCCLVFAPWQIYILHRFPDFAKYEYSLNSKHIYEAVEGHSGSSWFYLALFPQYFGKGIWLLVITGFVLSLFAGAEKVRSALAVCFVGVFLFFSFVVQSKLMSYFFVVAPIGYIYISITLGKIRGLKRYGKEIFSGAVILCCFFALNLQKIAAWHNEDDFERQKRIYNTGVYKGLSAVLPKGTKIVMNVNNSEDAECMFYNKGINAFHYCFNEEDLNELAKTGCAVGVFKERPGYSLPEYVKSYPGTIIIDSELKETN